MTDEDPGQVRRSLSGDVLTWDATWTDSPEPGGRDRTPIIPSHEMSGVVAALGPDVTKTGVGNEIHGLIPFVRDGAAAEYVTAPADILAAKPATVDHDAATAVPLAALTLLRWLLRSWTTRAAPRHRKRPPGGQGGRHQGRPLTARPAWSR